MPAELENLIDIARIKYLAKAKNITKIASKKTSVVFTCQPNPEPVATSDGKVAKETRNRWQLGNGISQKIRK